jgi:hypothetical protein
VNLCNKENISITGSSPTTSPPAYAGNGSLGSVLIAFHTFQDWLLQEISLHSEAHNLPKE